MAKKDKPQRDRGSTDLFMSAPRGERIEEDVYRVYLAVAIVDIENGDVIDDETVAIYLANSLRRVLEGNSNPFLFKRPAHRPTKQDRDKQIAARFYELRNEYDAAGEEYTVKHLQFRVATEFNLGISSDGTEIVKRARTKYRDIFS